jgi:small subunit ribosomal protein S17
MINDEIQNETIEQEQETVATEETAVSEAAEASEVPETSDASEVPETSDASEVPETAEASDTSDAAEASEVPAQEQAAEKPAKKAEKAAAAKEDKATPMVVVKRTSREQATAEAPEETDKEHRGRRKVRVGRVVSDKMDKTIVVAVQRNMRHPLYGKIVRRIKKYKAHDEKNDCHMGDLVEIIETHPISREKRWRVRSVVERAK